LHGYERIVELLLEHKAKVNHKNIDTTPLYAASVNGHHKIVELLIENKADVNEAN